MSQDGTKKTLNLVFVQINSSYSKQNIEELPGLIQKLKATVPFNEFNDAIAVWQLELSDKEVKAFFRHRDVFPYLSVRQDFLSDLEKRIGQPFKLVIIYDSGSVASAEISSIDKTSLIILSKTKNTQEIFLKKFLHELGHSLGLRDEGAHSYPCKPGPPNCAKTKEEAVRWWGDLVGRDNVSYFAGCCGNGQYIRPTAQSLMNDIRKSDNYGLVNERYLRHVLESYTKEN